MSKEIQFLKRSWENISSEPIPTNLINAFQEQIMPMMRVSSLTDPYIVDATNSLINTHLLSVSANILQQNAKSSEQLTEILNGTLKTKLRLKASAIVGATAVSACILVCGTFFVGVFFGAWTSEAMERRTIAKQETVAMQIAHEKEQREAYYKLIEKVNKDLMTCKDGRIEIDEKGRSFCYPPQDKGWRMLVPEKVAIE